MRLKKVKCFDFIKSKVKKKRSNALLEFIWMLENWFCISYKMYNGSNTSIYFIHVRQHGISRILETKNKKAYLDTMKFKTKEVQTWEDL